jgi:hypothetical protein
LNPDYNRLLQGGKESRTFFPDFLPEWLAGSVAESDNAGWDICPRNALEKLFRDGVG